MRATLLKITKHPSKWGGDFYYLFFKTEDGVSCKSCVTPNCRNYNRWASIIKNFDEADPIVLDNLVLMSNGMVNADSFPRIVGES